MNYKVRFRSLAKKELNDCISTYSCIREPLTLWLNELSEEAAQEKHEVSIDIDDLLADVAENASNFKLNNWELTKERLKKLGFIKKAKAFLSISSKAASFVGIASSS